MAQYYHLLGQMTENWLDEDALLYPEISSFIEVTHHDLEEDSWGRKFVTYSIEIQTNDISFNLPHSKVKRRFSDFVWLRKRILSVSPVHKRNIAQLPRRYLFSRIDRDVIAERQQGLQRFLQDYCTLYQNVIAFILLRDDLTTQALFVQNAMQENRKRSRVLRSETVLSDPCVHLLLQSTLSVSDIEEWMKCPKRQSSSKIILEGKGLVTPDRTEIQHYLRPPSRTSDNRSLCASTASDDFSSSPTFPINISP